MLSYQERTSDDSKEAEMYRDLLSARTQEFVEEVLTPHFGGLITFVKDAEMLLETPGHSERLQYEESESDRVLFWLSFSKSSFFHFLNIANYLYLSVKR